MARAPEIPAAALASIASEIGSRLPSLRAPGAAAMAQAPQISIGESFPVYMLGVDALRGGNRNLPEIARQTGVWQHQIRYGAQAQDIARSTAPPPGAAPGAAGWQVQEVVHSPAAPRIDEAIAWIDAHVSQDAVASILLVPAFYLTAFWLHEPDRDQVVIADMPPRLGDLQPLQLYAADEFLGKLAALQPISGVPTGQPPPGRAR